MILQTNSFMLPTYSTYKNMIMMMMMIVHIYFAAVETLRRFESRLLEGTSSAVAGAVEMVSGSSACTRCSSSCIRSNRGLIALLTAASTDLTSQEGIALETSGFKPPKELEEDEEDPGACC